MTDTNILCSIIIPYYNVPSELVDKCLNSILNQNWGGTRYEVIFVNDGSPLPISDSTKELFSKFHNFNLLEQHNGGLSSARNAGIKIANGNYIFFIDPDDYWFENRISDLIPYMKRQEYDIIKFQTAHIHNIKPRIDLPESSTTTTEYKIGCEYMASNNIIKGAWTYCYKTDFIIQNNILMPEGIIHEDEWFLTLAFYKANKCLFTPIPLYAYIKREGSIMSIKTDKQWKRSFNDFLYIIKRTLELRDNSSSPKANTAISNRLSYLLYGYIYNLTICSLPQGEKDFYLNELTNLKLYPLPDIGKSRMYKILRLCSKSNFTLKLFTKAVQAINKKRVDGKIY